MRALIISYTDRTSWQLPALLFRAGFVCDVLSPSPLFAKSQFVHRWWQPQKGGSIVMLARDLLQTNDPYDWIIISEDEILQEVLTADVPQAVKMQLLPVVGETHFSHVNSKIGLAKLLQAYGILSPAFHVVQSGQEAWQAADQLGYPVLLKVEQTSGGQGVYVCRRREDLQLLAHLFTGQSLLVQKKITGIEIDVSAVYRQGQLIHYSYSRVKAYLAGTSMALIRRYQPLVYVDNAVFDELSALGKALGADGFVNISAIETSDKRRYYFECDMRPNVWIHYPYFYKDDPATHIRRWFVEGLAFDPAVSPPNKNPPRFLDIAYFERMSFFEIMLNRYGVWRYLRHQDGPVIRALILRRLHIILIKLPVKKWVPTRVKAYLMKASSF